MDTHVISNLIRRDLEKLIEELKLYQLEKNIWKVQGNIANTAGNLCLHLIGNLNTYIGAEMGNTGYVRQRELEFSKRDLPRELLIQEVEKTRQMIEKVLSDFPESRLDEPYPQEVLGYPMSYRYFITHLAVHLGYHLGQVNYHRRLLDV
jgi:hypothetical protein